GPRGDRVHPKPHTQSSGRHTPEHPYPDPSPPAQPSANPHPPQRPRGQPPMGRRRWANRPPTPHLPPTLPHRPPTEHRSPNQPPSRQSHIVGRLRVERCTRGRPVGGFGVASHPLFLRPCAGHVGEVPTQGTTAAPRPPSRWDAAGFGVRVYS